MPTDSGLVGDDREALRELAPVLRRAVDLDAAVLTRLRLTSDRATALVRLPFAVLVSRSVQASRTPTLDITLGAMETLAWLDADGPQPGIRDAEWRGGLPPQRGWTRLETVPDDAIRPLVRQGALAVKDAAEREGVPGAQPRAEVADTLLDSVVLTADAGPNTAQVSLRMLSALTRMGFLRKGGHAHVDTAGRWVRVAGEFGTVYRERPGGLELA